MKKKIILADRDEIYLTNLSRYFMENAPQLELSLFTQPEKLYEYLESGTPVDILAVSDELAKPELTELAKGATRIVLSTSMSPVEGFGLVKKYQKTQTLLNEMLLLYAEASNSVEALRGENSTHIAAFYSPGGGTGKTTLALSLATVLGNEGKKVLYLNLEEIDSISNILEPASGGLTELFFALKSKGINVGLKAAACVGTEMQGKFAYFSGTESIFEYEEIKADELKRLIEAVKGLSEYELVIVDLSSAFSDKTICVLQEADLVFVPTIAEEGAIYKMQRLLQEQRLHNRLDSIFHKMHLIVNRAEVSGVGGKLQESGLLQSIPFCGAVALSPVFSSYGSILRSGTILGQAMEPMIREIKQIGSIEDD